jgi:diguanylate cyclase (GGDEF)-like protein/PAS domain S-box-containing protein
MMDASSVGILACGFDGECVLANEALVWMIGATREQVLSRNLRSLRSWHDSGLFAMAEEVMRYGEERAGDFHFTTTSGKDVWLNCVITPFESGDQRYFLLMAHDISSRKQQELAAATLVSAISKCPTLTVITDNAGIVEYVSDKISDITGFSSDEVIGKALHIFKPGVLAAVYEELWSVIRAGREWAGEIGNRRKDGSSYLEHIRIAPVFAADGTIDRFTAVIEDITKQKQLEEELYLHATTDSLTRLYNRRMILELGEHEVAVARRHGHCLALLMVNIDDFKSINDTYGHAAGDEALQTVAYAYRATLHTNDLVGRLAGNEFVVVLTEASPDEAQQAAKRLCEQVEQARIPWKESEIRCTVSVGVAMLQENDTSFEILLGKADKALHLS